MKIVQKGSPQEVTQGNQGDAEEIRDEAGEYKLKTRKRSQLSEEVLKQNFTCNYREYLEFREVQAKRSSFTSTLKKFLEALQASNPRQGNIAILWKPLIAVVL